MHFTFTARTNSVSVFFFCTVVFDGEILFGFSPPVILVFFLNYLFYLVKFRLLLQSFLNFTHAWCADSEIDTFTDLVKQGAEEETIANIVESLLCFIKLLSNEISASKLGIKKH